MVACPYHVIENLGSYAYTQARTHIRHIYTRTHRKHTHTHTHVHARAQVRTHTHTHTHMSTSTSTNTATQNKVVLIITQVERISNNLVRMMVSTTLTTITRLSQLVYDSKRGLIKTKKR